jgi:hypothetical protein
VYSAVALCSSPLQIQEAALEVFQGSPDSSTLGQFQRSRLLQIDLSADLQIHRSTPVTEPGQPQWVPIWDTYRAASADRFCRSADLQIHRNTETQKHRNTELLPPKEEAAMLPPPS